MERNKRIADFGDLNKFFDEHITPQEFLDDLADIINEYSCLALLNEQQIDTFHTACHISLLGNLHQEIRKIIR